MKIVGTRKEQIEVDISDFALLEALKKTIMSHINVPENVSLKGSQWIQSISHHTDINQVVRFADQSEIKVIQALDEIAHFLRYTEPKTK